MSLRRSKRGDIPPFIVMEAMRAAAEREATGADVLHLEVGQPSTPAPAGVRRAAAAALDGDLLGYTLAMGTPALRARLARHYAERYGATVDPTRICVTTGSSSGFLLAFLAAFDVGDRVALAAPSYPCYRNILGALGVEVVELPAAMADGFQPTVALLEQAAALGPNPGPIQGLIVASPANPTGTMLSRARYAELAGWCADHGARLISDEIYHGLTYGDPACSALEVCDDAIIVNSFSKYYSMTGWRLGWLVLPEDLARPVERLAQNFFISAPTLPQLAALAAFDCTDELEANRARYAANRALLLERLPAAGIRDFAPADGAFYLYADVGHLTDDSEAFCREILAATGVAITPGVDFDPARGGRYVRFSFAGATETMAEAARRLADYLPRRPRRA